VPSKQRPKRPRCSYREGTRPCRRLGSGNPPLCEDHILALKLPGRRSFSVSDLLDSAKDMLLGRVSVDTFKEVGIETARDWMASRLGDMDEDVPDQEMMQAMMDRIRHVERVAKNRANQIPAAPPPPRVQSINPRTVLGFPPEMPLTRELVKQRQRDLAHIYHPDKAGNVESMKMVNEATQKLLQSL